MYSIMVKTKIIHALNVVKILSNINYKYNKKSYLKKKYDEVKKII